MVSIALALSFMFSNTLVLKYLAHLRCIKILELRCPSVMCKWDVLVFKSPTRNAIGHVGIVTNPNGMETEFIHATSGKAYQVVVSSLKLEGYKNRFIKAVDVLD
jgi:hypothetical protein